MAARHEYRAADPANIEWDYTETPRGYWRRFRHANGTRYEEYISKGTMLGLRLLHVTRGISPETGKRVTARGIVAVGQRAMGVVSVGQISFGAIAVGQLALGAVFGLGQLATGLAAVGQAAVSLLAGVGQLATGYIAVGQLALGEYVLAQKGVGGHVWDSNGVSEVARAFFTGAGW